MTHLFEDVSESVTTALVMKSGVWQNVIQQSYAPPDF